MENYEERYKKAFEKAKEVERKYSHATDTYKEIINIFPELKESEGEKIRKWIINMINSISNNITVHAWFQDGKKDEMLSWLEKQKPIEHFNLKAGHWYFCYRAYCCRADDLTVKEGETFMCERDGVVKGFVIKNPEEYFREIESPTKCDYEQKTQ